MSREQTLLIVDDDPSNRKSYAMLFARGAYRLLQAEGGRQAIELLEREPVDVLITDLKMPEVDGLDVLQHTRNLETPPVCIVITAYGTIETAVEAMRIGAMDYLTKPVNPSELRVKVEKAFELRRLQHRNQELEGLVQERFRFEGVLGESQAMRRVIEQARMVAASRASVLVTGESGTGKELIARAIHFNSPRAKGPFCPIHCAALPHSLIEAELFGSEKGAYTGAEARRIGQFESADGGTVFLDELGEVPLETQVKLLRVLEQREITRIGASRPIPIDIRLVAATNKDLREEVRAGRFREDLYFRLNVVHIHLPPLRERPADIPAMVQHFLDVLARENERPRPDISPEALDCLLQAPWPGNIRELRNTLEQTLIFHNGPRIEPADLPATLRSSSVPGAPVTGPAPSDADSELPLEEVEKRHILQVLHNTDDNRTRAARKLGISRRTLQRKLKEMGMN